MILKCFLFILTVLRIQAESDRLDTRIYSTCKEDTNWTKGSGAVIKSWLQSIVPLTQHSRTKSSPTLKAEFDNNSLRTYLKTLYSDDAKIAWKVFGPYRYDGWLYGCYDPKSGEFVGDRTVYIYHDCTSAIIGRFFNGTLIEGRPARIKYYRCYQGIMRLRFSEPEEGIYRFEEPGAEQATSKPTLIDPFERRNVYVSDSNLTSMTHIDGLFAKKFIPPDTLVSVYAGVVMPVGSQIYHSAMTSDMREDRGKNLMALNSSHYIDIPPHMTSIFDYRASLGHKMNCVISANPRMNAKYCWMTHPRFGFCRCVRSVKSIHKGEEVLGDYHYNIDAPDVPRWYKKLHDEAYKDKMPVGSSQLLEDLRDF